MLIAFAMKLLLRHCTFLQGNENVISIVIRWHLEIPIDRHAFLETLPCK